MQRRQIGAELCLMTAGNRLGDAACSDGIRGGVMGVVQNNPVGGCSGLKGAFTLAVPVDCLIDHQWVDDRGRQEQRRDAVTNRFPVEERQIIGRVVDGESKAAVENLLDGQDDLGDDLRSRPALSPRALGRDAMDRAGPRGDIDARVGEPVLALDTLPGRIEDPNVGRNDAARLDVDPGGFEIEYPERVKPCVTHGSRLLPTTGKAGRADMEPVKTLGA